MFLLFVLRLFGNVLILFELLLERNVFREIMYLYCYKNLSLLIILLETSNIYNLS